MSFQAYTNLLTSMPAYKDNTQCNVCLQSLEGPAGIDEEGRYVGEHLLATCRFPCGCTYHNACIARWMEQDSCFDKCPTCRSDMFPSYPICPNCEDEIKPSDTVTTFPNSRIRMHFSCSVAWLKIRGPLLPGQTIEQMLEAMRNVVRPRPLSPSLPSSSAAAPGRGPSEPSRQSHHHNNNNIGSPRRSESDSQPRDEVIVLGEMTRDSSGRRTWRSISPIL